MLYTARYDEEIRPKLDVLDKIRPYLKEEDGIQTPAIVVCGDQSAGKSSVIESISGIQLPRGQGIVTRAPLELQLRAGKHIRAELSYTPAGGTPVSQPRDNYDRVKALNNKYLAGHSKVILCVMPANVDFATCEAINLAEQHDPEKRRTLGVVTKIDKAEKGIRARLGATGDHQVRLEMGIIAVRNKTQEEVESNTPADEALELERAFFDGHPELSAMPRDVLGKPALVNKLVEIQADVICTSLPALQEQVQAKLTRTLEELNQMHGIVESEDEAHRLVFQRLNRLQQAFHDLHKGEYEMLKGAALEDKRRIAAKVWDIFVDYDKKYIEQVLVMLIEDILEDFPRLTLLVKAEIKAIMQRQEADASAVIRRLMRAQREVFTVNDYYLQTLNKMKTDVQRFKAWKDRRLKEGEPTSAPALSPATEELAGKEFIDKLAGSASP
ncbi:hypothetical protein WJX72_008773 [[Myrmecia] bisecta]|uniref:Dynamin GTPase domain-containing protein n=1 Tax=[Myrmecia] bisecta TaxID=41462 RepID=A0AAW1QG65_9CHLO